MSLAQSVPLPGAISVTAFLPHTTRFDGGGSGAGAGAGAGSGAEPSTSRTPEHVLVVCPNDVFVLRMVPLVMQVAALVSRRPAEFEEALALCEHCHSEGVRPSQAHLATSHVPQLAHTRCVAASSDSRGEDPTDQRRLRLRVVRTGGIPWRAVATVVGGRTGEACAGLVPPAVAGGVDASVRLRPGSVWVYYVLLPTHVVLSRVFCVVPGRATP